MSNGSLYRYTIAALITVLSVAVSAQDSLPVKIRTFVTVPRLHIRALDVKNDSVAWFAANRGVWGYTRNGGRSWHIDSIFADSIYPHFRAMHALNDSTVLLLSIASPAYLYKTNDYGKSWRKVYTNGHKDIFFDALAFPDAKNGMAIGDPINGCFQIIETHDGGESWKQRACSEIPAAAEGEACFATSNTNLRIIGKNRWFVTGGKRSRLFFSKDNGKHYTTIETPLPQGETMTGVFSFDFYDAKTGVIAGGHYEKTDTSIASLAATTDGGKTWNVIRSQKPFFGSCVRFFSRYQVLVTGHNGTFLVDLKNGHTTELKSEQGDTLKYFTLRFAPSGRFMWLAGSGGRLARVEIPFSLNPQSTR